MITSNTATFLTFIMPIVTSLCLQVSSVSDEQVCDIVRKQYPTFTLAQDSVGHKVIVDIDRHAASTSRFNSPELKQRCLSAFLNLPYEDGDIVWSMLHSDSISVLLLDEYSFAKAEEVQVLKYAVLSWWVKGWSTIQILVGYNQELDNLYVLTHPNMGYRAGHHLPPVRPYEQAVMKGNFNAMLSDSRAMRKLHPLCLAGLWAGCGTWIPSYPTALVTTQDELLNAFRAFRARAWEFDSIDKHSADEVILFFPGRDKAGPADYDFAGILPGECEAIVDSLIASGLELTPIVEKKPNCWDCCAWRAEFTILSMCDNTLYRIEVKTDVAGLIDSWRFLGEPVKLPVSF